VEKTREGKLTGLLSYMEEEGEKDVIHSPVFENL